MDWKKLSAILGKPKRTLPDVVLLIFEIGFPVGLLVYVLIRLGQALLS